nr:S-layer homology domain-containing protein [Anaeroglobus geminatus]
MKKKVLASLVATMAVTATCALAANPFADVPQDSWAYNSVVELANSGIVQGVDGVHFQGERNITRYEAAEMVAKAMAHEDRANAEQRALINKLADEFSDELNTLGVRGIQPGRTRGQRETDR